MVTQHARRTRLVGVGLLLLLPLMVLPWGCRRRAPATSSESIMRWRVAVPMTSMDPLLTVDAATLQIHLNTYSLLFRQRTDGTIEPSLAMDASSSDGGKAWRLRLRRGVEFCGPHGGEVTAGDVVATLHRAATDPTSRVAWVFRDIARDDAGSPRIWAAGDTEVAFQFTEPIDLPRYLALPQLGILPADLASAPHPDFGGVSHGSGPYRIAQVRPGKIVLEACPAGWPHPSLDRVELEVIRDPEVAFGAFAAGRIDGMELSLAQQYEVRKGEVPTGGRVITVPKSVHWEFLAFNTKGGKTSSPDVRRALMYALDRQALCKGPLLDSCVPADFVSAALGRPIENDPLYRPELARKLWTEAPEKPDKIEVLSPANQRSVTVARYAAQAWQRLFGLSTTVIPLDNGPLLGRLFSGEDFDISGFWVQPLVDLPEIWYLAWQPEDQPPAGRNFTRYGDPEFAAVFNGLRRGELAFDTPQVASDLERIQEQDPPAIPVFQRRVSFVVRDDIRWKIGRQLSLEFWTVEVGAR